MSCWSGNPSGTQKSRSSLDWYNGNTAFEYGVLWQSEMENWDKAKKVNSTLNCSVATDLLVYTESKFQINEWIDTFLPSPLDADQCSSSVTCCFIVALITLWILEKFDCGSGLSVVAKWKIISPVPVVLPQSSSPYPGFNDITILC